MGLTATILVYSWVPCGIGSGLFARFVQQKEPMPLKKWLGFLCLGPVLPIMVLIDVISEIEF
jgi:hypothetical protein